jgi:hypothetical protein
MQHEWGEEECIWDIGGEARKRPLGRPRRRWLGNIKIDLRYDGMVWSGSMWFRIRTSGGLL